MYSERNQNDRMKISGCLQMEGAGGGEGQERGRKRRAGGISKRNEETFGGDGYFHNRACGMVYKCPSLSNHLF